MGMLPQLLPCGTLLAAADCTQPARGDWLVAGSQSAAQSSQPLARAGCQSRSEKGDFDIGEGKKCRQLKKERRSLGAVDVHHIAVGLLGRGSEATGKENRGV